MFDFMAREVGGRGIAALFAFLLGGLVSWALGRWRRYAAKTEYSPGRCSRHRRDRTSPGRDG